MGKLLYSLLGVGAVIYMVVAMLSPSDLPSRRVERNSPLEAPVPVLDIYGDQIVTATGSFKLAGVKLPEDSLHLASARAFLHVCTAQGIERIRQVDPSSWMIRCEPRIWHGCGLDAVEAHYEQHHLNELIVILGYAFFQDSIHLTEVERIRLRAASQIAKQHQKGIWSDGTSDEYQRFSKHGIDFTEVIGIDVKIRHLSR